jgi:hypothetical protein
MEADRSSDVDYEDCGECAEETGSGVCANCEDDGGYCSECGGTARCPYCEGTGRRRIEADPKVVEEVRRAGPLIVPESEQ